MMDIVELRYIPEDVMIIPERKLWSRLGCMVTNGVKIYHYGTGINYKGIFFKFKLVDKSCSLFWYLIFYGKNCTF